MAITRPVASLDEKFDLTTERVLLNGAQAAVRLTLMQHERDRRAGLHTAGYVSGYRGSPIAGMESQFARAKAFVDAADIKFHAAINEDLAATALWGTQQAELRGEGKFDGVFGIWYGKGPGVDRAGDALRHANHAGTSKSGGVIAIAGDDHTCESSTTAHQSEPALIDAMIPVLHPAGVQEILDYGVHGFAMSRYAGVWVALKCVKDNFESTSVVDGRVDRVICRLPDDFALPAGGLGIRLADPPVAREERLHRFKKDAALAYARANRLDRVIFSGGTKPRLGIVTTGKSYLDVRAALDALGIDEKRAAAIGLALYKVAMVWPLEPHGIIGFARGLDQLIVVEEKRSIIEAAVKDELYHLKSAPQIVGKRDEDGAPLFQAHGALDTLQIAVAIGERLLRFADPTALKERVASLKAAMAARGKSPDIAARTPYFCAGCPHNSSTVVPDGSRAYAGIGCHYMAQFMDRATEGFTHMGGEGANWIGEAPFSNTGHVFQNIGDGTYVHSGSMAIRGAVSSGVNITYKILYNDAVAMTGGQPIDGGKTVGQMAAECAAEGARRIAIVTDEPEKYSGAMSLPHGTTVHHRDDLDVVQKNLREVQGVSVLIYDQTCAAEKRRRRKRGQFPDPARRVFINEAVCEGCGDCGRQSNCVAIIPVETDLGRKRAIDQSACNKDFSCLEGFCPSFVTVEGGALRKPQPSAALVDLDTIALAEPSRPAAVAPTAMLVNGIGGTGVVTIMAVLAEAAHRDGLGFSGIEMTGMAQKGGSVLCHLRFAADQASISAIRVGVGGADAVIGCDLVVTGARATLEAMAVGRTSVVVNTHETLTGDFTRNPELRLPGRRLLKAIEERVGTDKVTRLDANEIAVRVFGDSIAANMLMLGIAFQLGQVPVSASSIELAIGLNGQAVTLNRRAFRLGRLYIADHAAFARIAGVDHAASADRPADTLSALIERRVLLLTDFQDAALAQRYRDRIEAIAIAEQVKAPGKSGLVEAAARSLAKLMAYKDEYEVARLYTDGTFAAAVGEVFEGDFRLRYHLAPPLLARLDPATGHPRKVQFRPWMATMFRLLAAMKGLRGTFADPFGRTAERRTERRLIDEFERTLDVIDERLRPENHAFAVELAALPLSIRGFGHVKTATIEAAAVRQAELMREFAAAAVAAAGKRAAA